MDIGQFDTLTLVVFSDNSGLGCSSDKNVALTRLTILPQVD